MVFIGLSFLAWQQWQRAETELRMPPEIVQVYQSTGGS